MKHELTTARPAAIASTFRLAAVALLLSVAAAVVAPVASAAPDLSKSITGTVSNGGNSMPYRLFRPAGYDAPGAKFPLVLFMHGAGERGTDNVAQVNSHIDGLVSATQSSSYASYLLAPQVPTSGQWVNVPFSTGAYTNATAPAESTSVGLTLQLIDQLVAGGTVDPNRIYVTGLSMGGYGTFDILARRPGLFAAAVPMSGGGNKDTASTIKNVPLWAFHGSADPTVPVSGSRDMIAALRAAGGSPLYNELAGQGHVIWSPIYNDTSAGGIYPWMFSQSVPEPGAAAVVLIAAAGAIVRRKRRIER